MGDSLSIFDNLLVRGLSSTLIRQVFRKRYLNRGNLVMQALHCRVEGNILKKELLGSDRVTLIT